MATPAAVRTGQDNAVRLAPGWTDPRRVLLRQLTRHTRAALARHLNPGHTLLDYGCGNMPYRDFVRARGATYRGADLPWNPHAETHLDPNGRILAPDHSADAVLSTQVLEHVADPALYLAEAHRVLRPGGLLLLSTHGYWMYHPDPTDFWRWTSAGLRRTLETAGFRVLEQHGMLNRAAAGWQLVQDGLIFKLPRPLRPLWALAMQLGVAALDRIGSDAARNLDAANYLIVARKA